MRAGDLLDAVRGIVAMQAHRIAALFEFDIVYGVERNGAAAAARNPAENVHRMEPDDMVFSNSRLRLGEQCRKRDDHARNREDPHNPEQPAKFRESADVQ
jgi:hypothetical protein